MDRRSTQSRYSTLVEAPPCSSWESRSPYEVGPGLCVIINNTVFMHVRGLPGGRRDEEGLHVIFTTLGFDVRIHQNLTAQEIIHTAKTYSQMQHEGVFFLIILSHGMLINNKHVVFGTDGSQDGGTVEINNLESMFHATNCPSLREVPKIFVIDACRGSRNERVHQPKVSARSGDMVARSADVDMISINSSPAAVTDSSHFAIVYASTYGNVAFASSRGSQLTQTFVSVIAEATPEESFTDIIREVQTRIQRSITHHQTVELVDRLNHPYFIKRGSPLTDVQELHRRYRRAVEQWIPLRKVTIQEIQSTIENLKMHHRNVNISRITGSAASITGSVIAIVGFAISPITFGASIGLSVGGIALAVAGGGTAAGASIADVVIQKTNVKHAQNQLDRDNDQLKAIAELAETISNHIDSVRQQCQGVSSGQFIAVFGEVFAQGFIRTSNLGMRLAELAVFGTLEVGVAALRIGGAAAKGVAAAAIALNIVLIPIDLIEIVRSSVSLARGSQTKAIKQLSDLVVQLQQQMQAIQEQVQL